MSTDILTSSPSELVTESQELKKTSLRARTIEMRQICTTICIGINTELSVEKILKLFMLICDIFLYGIV